jgi:hypothetical protein
MHVHDSSMMFLIQASPPAVICFDAWISLFVQASVAHDVVASLTLLMIGKLGVGVGELRES